MMKKYYSEVFSGFSKFVFCYLFIMDILAPIAMVLPIYFNDTGRIINLCASIFCHASLYTAFALNFGFKGPLPSDKKSMSYFTEMYNSVNGNPTDYFMSCVIPAKRKELIDLPVKLILSATAVHCLSLLAIPLFGGAETAKAHTITVIFETLFIIMLPFCFMSVKRNYIAVKVIMSVLSAALAGILFVSMFDRLPAFPILPLPIRIAMSIIAFLSNILFFRSTVYKGEFARNGEKIR